MKSYIYPKLLRDEMQPKFADNPDARSAQVNDLLVNTPAETLMRAGIRRARQSPKAPYEPLGVAITDDAMRVLQGLPVAVSRSALIQWMLR